MRMSRALTMLLVGVGVALGAAACAQPRASQPAAGSPQSASDAVGDDYAAQIGLIRHDWTHGAKLQQTSDGLTMDGELLEGCATPPEGMSFAYKILPSGHLYCFQGTSDLDVWIISERLGGHVPTPEEIAQASPDFDRTGH